MFSPKNSSETKGFPGGSVIKNLPANAGDRDSIPWVGKIPWRREQQLTPVFLPEKFHGQRNLGGYSPRGCKESDMTEQLSMDAGTRHCFTSGGAVLHKRQDPFSH